MGHDYLFHLFLGLNFAPYGKRLKKASSMLDPSSDNVSKLSGSYKPSIAIPQLESDVQSEGLRSNSNELPDRCGIFYTGMSLIAQDIHSLHVTISGHPWRSLLLGHSLDWPKENEHILLSH